MYLSNETVYKAANKCILQYELKCWFYLIGFFTFLLISLSVGFWGIFGEVLEKRLLCMFLLFRNNKLQLIELDKINVGNTELIS